MKTELKQQVFLTADALLAEGVSKPTNAQVRDRIGSGSLSHISPLMGEWRELRQKESAEKNAIPGDIKLLADSTLSQLWSCANTLANQTLHAVKIDHSKQIEEKIAEQQELLSEIDRLEKELSDNVSEIERLQQKELASNSTVSELKVELASLNERLANQNNLLKDKDAQLTSLRSSQSELISRLDSMNAEVIKLSSRMNA